MDNYFFSIQPFWGQAKMPSPSLGRPGLFDISEFENLEENLPCVLGNGQMAIRIGGGEELRGFCFGVLDWVDDIPSQGIENGVFIRFAPGVFSRVFHVSAAEISPFGVPMEDIVSKRKIEDLKKASASPDRLAALGMTVERWIEEADSRKRYGENALAHCVLNMIWQRGGNVRVADLSEETGYTVRYLQDVTNRQVGLSPKKLCKHIRFQRTLKLLDNPSVSHLEAAQIMGYSDQAHYCREFKDCCGMSPGEYRKMRVR